MKNDILIFLALCLYVFIMFYVALFGSLAGLFL
jgi:hypothetical protein